MSARIGLMEQTVEFKPHKAHVAPREVELDFIRGIAILLVVDFHTTELLSKPAALLGYGPFGWVGVSIFFTLSGFLVGGLLMKEWKVRHGIDSKRFLIRRGFKIWPLYYAFLLVQPLLGHRSFRQLAGNLLNIQNYTDGIPHTWSLAVEEHVYIFLVLVLSVAARRKARLRTLFLFLCGVCLCVTIGRLFLAQHNMHVYKPTHTRMDGILIGVMLAMVYHFAPEVFAKLQSMRWLLWCGIALAMVLPRLLLHIPILHRNPNIVAGGFHYDAGNLLAVCMLLILYRKSPTGKRNPLYRAVAWIGVYSYGIYLLQPSVNAPVRTFAAHHPQIPGEVAELAAAILGTVIGIAGTKLVELPALRLRDKLFPKRVDSAVGLPAVVEAELASEAVSEQTVQVA